MLFGGVDRGSISAAGEAAGLKIASLPDFEVAFSRPLFRPADFQISARNAKKNVLLDIDMLICTGLWLGTDVTLRHSLLLG